MIEQLAAQLQAGSNRRSRRDFILDRTPGLYAIFLKPGSTLPVILISGETLVYLGKAQGAGGLKSRCHFNGGTRNHSPRKSLAVLLEKELGLVARRVNDADGSYKTWALEPTSERMLDGWMHANLGIAFATLADAPLFEKQLIERFAPPLNLTDCAQSESHRSIVELRRRMDNRMRLALL